MPEPEVEVSVGPGVRTPVEPARVEAAVRRVLAAEGAGEGEVSVALVGDAEIAALNRQYLSRDRPTDVIAFSLHGPGEPLVGDVYVGVDQAARQAEEYGADVAEEVLRLAVHGTLHVLGYDHPEGEDRTGSPMFVLQEELLRQVLAEQAEGLEEP
jgi:probable rRNA maturation factor